MVGMSFSTLFFVAVCTAMYKLGAFNERHPGRLREWSWRAVLWSWRSLNK
jgi:hypothetical protein